MNYESEHQQYVKVNFEKCYLLIIYAYTFTLWWLVGLIGVTHALFVITDEHSHHGGTHEAVNTVLTGIRTGLNMKTSLTPVLLIVTSVTQRGYKVTRFLFAASCCNYGNNLGRGKLDTNILPFFLLLFHPT